MEDDLKADFLFEIDDYYMKVSEGMKLVKSNHVLEGIDMTYETAPYH